VRRGFSVRIVPRAHPGCPQETGLQFELHRLAHALGQHEIHAFRHTDLSGRLNARSLAKRRKKVSRGFGFAPFSGREHISQSRVTGNRFCIGRKRQEFDAVRLGENHEGLSRISSGFTLRVS